MKKALTWIGRILGALVMLVIVLVLGIYVVSGMRMSQTYDVPADKLTLATQAATIDALADEPTLATQAATIERGRHVITTRGCFDCHGENLGGRLFISNPVMGNFYASNLTPGSGGVGQTYTDADWVRSIRHGVGPDKKPLLFMPSYEFYPLSDDDLAAIIAYIKNLPPVDTPAEESSPGILARVLFLTGKMDLLSAERIPHAASRPEAPAPGVTAAYGQYLAVSCTGCHGSHFSGGPIPGVPPDWPPSANITPDQATGIGTWEEQDFVTALREGKRPDGSELSPVMPRPLGKMTDEELKAIWLYLQTLPPMAASNR